MNGIKYLIVAEIYKKGFILKIIDGKKEALSFLQKTSEISSCYSFAQMNKVEEKLEYIASYKINGNTDYVGKYIKSISNGAYTVSVLQIDINTFCLKSFIRERENHSSVFELEQLSEEFSEHYFFGLIAN